jgi:hypothetical protein
MKRAKEPDRPAGRRCNLIPPWHAGMSGMSRNGQTLLYDLYFITTDADRRIAIAAARNLPRKPQGARARSSGRNLDLRGLGSLPCGPQSMPQVSSAGGTNGPHALLFFQLAFSRDALRKRHRRMDFLLSTYPSICCGHNFAQLRLSRVQTLGAPSVVPNPRRPLLKSCASLPFPHRAAYRTTGGASLGPAPPFS